MSRGTSPTGGPAPGNLALAAGLLVVIFAGYIVLSLAGRDTTGYIALASGPVCVSIIGGLLWKRVAVTEQLARTAVEQTNGLMSAQFDDVHEHLDGQTGILLAGLKEDPPAAVPARYKTSSSGSATGPLPEQRPPGVRPDQAVDR